MTQLSRWDRLLRLERVPDNGACRAILFEVDEDTQAKSVLDIREADYDWLAVDGTLAQVGEEEVRAGRLKIESEQDRDAYSTVPYFKTRKALINNTIRLHNSIRPSIQFRLKGEES